MSVREKERENSFVENLKLAETERGIGQSQQKVRKPGVDCYEGGGSGLGCGQ